MALILVQLETKTNCCNFGKRKNNPIFFFLSFRSSSGLNNRATTASVIIANPQTLPIASPGGVTLGVLPPPTPPKGYADPPVHPHPHHIPPSPDLPPLPPLPPGASEIEENHPLMTHATLDVASLQSQNSQNLQAVQNFANSMDSPRDVIGGTNSRISPPQTSLRPQQLNLRKEPLYTITSVSGNGPAISSMLGTKPSGKQSSSSNNADAPPSEISV